MGTSRVTSLRRQLNVIAEEIARLEARPEEPPVGSVIRFTMQFTNAPELRYDYAAIHAGDDRWYTTGRALRSYTWAQLLDWMEEGTDAYMLMRPSSCNQMTEIKP